LLVLCPEEEEKRHFVIKDLIYALNYKTENQCNTVPTRLGL